MSRLPSRFNLLTALLLAALLLPLLAFAFLGHFMRYMGDDWCTAAVINKVGLLQAQWKWYVGWTGRFSFTLVSGVAHLPGPRVAPVVPALMLASWLGAACWACRQIALSARWPSPLLASVAAAELIVFATLNTAHNIVQSFYWQTGALTYVAPLILLTLYVGLVVYGARRRGAGRSAATASALAFVVTLVAGGFSEVYTIMQTGGLCLAAAACYAGGRAFNARASFGCAALPPILAGLAGSCVALLVVALAPGNEVRQSFFTPPPDLLSLAKISLYYATGHVPYTVYLSPFTTLLTLTVPALEGFYLHATDPVRARALDLRNRRRLLIFLPVVGYLLILLCYVPAAYATATYLPGRARIIPQFVSICFTASWGYLAGAALAKYLCARRQNVSGVLTAGLVLAAALMVLSPASAAWRVLTLVEGARESAAVFDRMDREIRAAKERGVLEQTVTAVADVETRFGADKTELHIERDPGSWKNKCVARFYGVSSVKTQ